MNKLNNRYPQKQVQPITIRDKEITDDKKIANYFNTYFSNAHKLTNNFKKQEKTFKRNLRTPTNNTFKEILYTNFSEEELKEAIRNTKAKTAQTRQHFSRIYSQPRSKITEDTNDIQQTLELQRQSPR